MKNICIIVAISALVSAGMAAELLIGAAEITITPDKPIMLAGQFHRRVSTGVESPCMANVVALEARADGKMVDVAVLVSLDVVSINNEVYAELREAVGKRLPGFDVSKLVVGVTHTHTGPVLGYDWYEESDQAMKVAEYRSFLSRQVAEGVAQAWEARKPGAMGWGMGHVVVGQNRRASYADGTAVMYGNVNKPDFIGLEGWEDHALDVIGFVDAAKKLTAVMLVVPCPSQVIEGMTVVSADYWGNVRRKLKELHGEELVIAGFCAPAGDFAPRPMLRKGAEARMEKLRGVDRKAELARRIVNGFEDVWGVVGKVTSSDIKFEHRIEKITLTGRLITDAEYKEACRDYAYYQKRLETVTADSEKTIAISRSRWFKRTMGVYETQKENPPKNEVELHVLRLGEVAIATNPFELFTDYNMRVQGRSKAGQTIMIQLTSPIDPQAGYLPSLRAERGGGYSAVPQSGPVGHIGGQELVEHTVRVINGMFE